MRCIFAIYLLISDFFVYVVDSARSIRQRVNMQNIMFEHFRKSYFTYKNYIFDNVGL